jgi:hypothetical protein
VSHTNAINTHCVELLNGESGVTYSNALCFKGFKGNTINYTRESQ